MTPDTIEIIRSAKETGERLAQGAPLAFGADPGYDVPSILVDTNTRFQTIEGFGGAFTEAAATTFFKMNPEAQAAVLKAYFDPQEGIGYTLCRTHINSCDFALDNYAYDETPGDTALEHFSIERDRKALIPFIRLPLKRRAGRSSCLLRPGRRRRG